MRAASRGFIKSPEPAEPDEDGKPDYCLGATFRPTEW